MEIVSAAAAAKPPHLPPTVGGGPPSLHPTPFPSVVHHFANPLLHPPPARRRIYLTYHQLAMTWGWYMLEPWEVALWMALLALIFYAVVAACFINPKSICNTTLVTLRNSLAAQGGRGGRPGGTGQQHAAAPAGLPSSPSL